AMGEPVGGLSPYEAAEKSVQAVKNLLAALQVPYRLSQYGIPKDHLPKLIEGGMKQARLFVPNPRDVIQEDLKSIYEKAF
ncbi:MAG TPA: iron-containing alcohol dehydrogenase, partial [Thermodesulfobacteriota bacterium]|nr:iron-containing alcohol dehydrogenase [Thermodesulfobacteriota bacterium]